LAGTGVVDPLGATGPVSSGRARRVILTVSFFSGTVEVFVEGFGGSGVCGSVSLIVEIFKKLEPLFRPAFAPDVNTLFFSSESYLAINSQA
jgi:hypothetical protein